MKKFLLFILFAAGVVSATSAREIYSLNSGWKFFYADENSSDNAREVSLPHTWNVDAFVGGESYRRTLANYQRTLFILSNLYYAKYIYYTCANMHECMYVYVVFKM